MSELITQRIEAARNGTNPTVISRLPSGWVVMCDMQFLPGYCILLADPVVPSLNALNERQRARYLVDMSLVGDALLEVTGAYRINYSILGNTDPYLHAHIVPRYMDEPEQYRQGLPWSYSKEHLNSRPFDLQRDQLLMQQIAAALQKSI
jgi:diadenosine tetraphosphate (Ap4A) HIT family hydrolase